MQTRRRRALVHVGLAVVAAVARDTQADVAVQRHLRERRRRDGLHAAARLQTLHVDQRRGHAQLRRDLRAQLALMTAERDLLIGQRDTLLTAVRHGQWSPSLTLCPLPQQQKSQHQSDLVLHRHDLE